MLKLRLAGVALLTLLSATVAAFGQNVPAEIPRPVALVIGNGSYPQSARCPVTLAHLPMC
jgi:hypothetical protein